MKKNIEIPNSPGSYIFKDDKSRVIYIGKAKNLKKRVASYFSRNDLDPKTQQLVQNIADVDFIATRNEIEALILENNLIKKHQPKYNINLKDSKRYAYIKITDEEFPRVLLARKISKDGKYFGPFTSGAERDLIIEIVNKAFKLRTCRKLPRKACLRYHIGLCDAPCIENIREQDYLENINDATVVLKGESNELLRKLAIRMKGSSEKKDFEKAIIAREQIKALEYLNQKQAVERQKKYDEDIINFIVKDETVYLLLFNISKGMLLNKQEFVFDYSNGFLTDFLMQYYEEPIKEGEEDIQSMPKEIIVPKEVDPALAKYFEKKKGSKVRIIVPKKGEKKLLMDLVQKNIELSFFGNMQKVEELGKKLRLSQDPTVIECFDISHLGGTNVVGSMVQFRNGKADKSNYRRFKIRTVNKIDDFASIAEVIRRRYTRLKKEQQQMPNLIVIDGGIGQLSAAIKELDRLELKIPIISLAKRLEEIYTPGISLPISLPEKDKALLFLRQIRDEAHRFAINYNRLLRSKEIRNNKA